MSKTAPSFAQRVEAVAERCRLDARLRALSCRPHTALHSLMQRVSGLSGRERAEALGSTIALLGRDDADLAAVGSEILARVFSHGLGEGVTEVHVSQGMLHGLLTAYETLPPYRARRILPAATHVAVLQGALSSLRAAVDAKGDESGRARVVERMMVYGRLAVLEELDAALRDPELAGVALRSMRAMGAWTPKEQAALCPRALRFLAGADLALSARAAQVMRSCHGPSYTALVERLRALDEKGKLASHHLAAFYGRCASAGEAGDAECANAVAYMLALAAGRANAALLRAAAASQLAGLTEDRTRREPMDMRPIRRLLGSLSSSEVVALRNAAENLRMALDRVSKAEQVGVSGDHG